MPYYLLIIPVVAAYMRAHKFVLDRAMMANNLSCKCETLAEAELHMGQFHRWMKAARVIEFLFITSVAFMLLLWLKFGGLR